MRTPLALLCIVGLAAATISTERESLVDRKNPLLTKKRYDVENVGRSEIFPYSKKGVYGGKKRMSEDTSTYKVEINNEEIEELIDDFKDFGDRYLTTTKKERVELMNKLRIAFKNTAAKMILNFGAIFPPVV